MKAVLLDCTVMFQNDGKTHVYQDCIVEYNSRTTCIIFLDGSEFRRPSKEIAGIEGTDRDTGCKVKIADGKILIVH